MIDGIAQEMDARLATARAEATGVCAAARDGEAIDGAAAAAAYTPEAEITALALAAVGGHLTAVEAILAAGGAPDDETLAFACAGGHLVCVQALLGAGGAARPCGFFMTTPLTEAARAGHHAIVDLLLSAGGRVKKEDGRTLCLAARGGHAAVVRRLLSAGFDPHTRTPASWTPLLAAAASGSMATIEALVHAGASAAPTLQYGDPGMPKDSGALHLAIAAGAGEAVPLLIGAGAEVAGVDGEGRTPLRLAACAGLPHIEAILRAAGAPDEDLTAARLLGAASRGDLKAINAALAAGAAADTRDGASFGATPLIVAAGAGRIEAVDRLLAVGAQLDATDDPNGQWRRQWRHVAREIEVERLVTIRRMDAPWGRTALHAAVEGGHADVAGLLVDRGADLGAADHLGWTALHLARWLGDGELADHLLDAGASPKARDFQKRTPADLSP